MRAHPLRTKIDERERVLEQFLEREQQRLALTCLDLARSFSQGGLLIAYGSGPAATDAAHVAVEFMHPVIVGKRALPAVAPSSDPSGAATVQRLGRAGDVALAIAHAPADAEARAFLAAAADRGLLTIALGADRMPADHAFEVPTGDPAIAQEVQETTYHVLWELVHVFLDQPALLETECVTCGDIAVEATVLSTDGTIATVRAGGATEQVAAELVGELSVGDRVLCHAGVALERLAPEDPSGGMLYPFLDGGGESDLETVVADVAASTVRKGADTIELRRALDLVEIERCADAVRAALLAGGRLLTIGNGGSATDAQDVATDALARGWPAIALVNDPATITAVGNDVGFDNVFSRQLIPLARQGDVVLAITTSGSSPNILSALREAHRRGALTCAIAGYAGGRLVDVDGLDHMIRVAGDYVPRLQEAHATAYHLLLDMIGDRP
jgi:D-sedoheptulose 7-phosphate isomerase